MTFSGLAIFGAALKYAVITAYYALTSTSNTSAQRSAFNIFKSRSKKNNIPADTTVSQGSEMASVSKVATGFEVPSHSPGSTKVAL